MFLIAAALLGSGSPANAALSISPSTIDNAYIGPLDLAITGLNSNGQSVIIEEYYDSDNSGTITAGDRLLHKFVVIDGQVVSIGGQRDLNIPGDEDGVADGTIHTRLLYSSGEIPGRIDGPHIFRVSPSGAGFIPFTAALNVTQHDYAGSGISGSVTSGVAQPGALVFLLAPSGNDQTFVAGTIADSNGNYSLKAAPGSYHVMAAQSGFVCNLGAASTITVAAGTFVTGQTATLTASARTISGALRDAGTLAGLPGVAVQGQSNSGFFSLTLTDGNGNYSMDATSGSWKIGFDEHGVARLGCLTFKTTEGSAGSVTGLNIDLPHEASLIYGTLKTPTNTAVPFTDLHANTNGSPNYKTAGISDVNGNYTLGVTSGAWQIQFQPVGYLVQNQNIAVNTAGTAVLQNLIANPITTHLRGQIHDNHGNIVPNIAILAFDASITNDVNNLTSYGSANATGNFDLGVFGGGGTATKPWQLQLTTTSNSPPAFVSSNPIFNVQDGIDINGINYLVYQITAHLIGHVLDENSNPIGNINIFATLNPNNVASSDSNVDSGGNFNIPVFGGNWSLGLSNITGLGLIPQDFSTTVTDGNDQTGLIFRAFHANFTITGTVKSNANIAIPGVAVLGTTTNNGNNYNTSAITAGDGSYSLPVFSSTWKVAVDSNGLASKGYQPVSNQDVFVSGNLSNINFIAQPLFKISSIVHLANGHILLQGVGAPNAGFHAQASPDLGRGVVL